MADRSENKPSRNNSRRNPVREKVLRVVSVGAVLFAPALATALQANVAKQDEARLRETQKAVEALRVVSAVEGLVLLGLSFGLKHLNLESSLPSEVAGYWAFWTFLNFLFLWKQSRGFK